MISSSNDSFPKVLFVVPVFNMEKYIRKTIDSLLSTDYPDFDILIIDDGSTDLTARIISTHFKDFVIYQYQRNQGPSAAMNKGILYAKENDYKYIARSDGDDISHPNRLKKQINLLEEFVFSAACSSNCNYIDENTGEIIGGSTVAISPKLIKLEIKLGLRGCIQGATTFRTTSLQDIGGYDHSLSQAEDTDIFMRLSEKYPLINSPEILYSIRVRENSLSNKNLLENRTIHFFVKRLNQVRRNNGIEFTFYDFEKNLSNLKKLLIRIDVVSIIAWQNALANKDIFQLVFSSILNPKKVVFRILRKLDEIIN